MTICIVAYSSVPPPPPLFTGGQPFCPAIMSVRSLPAYNCARHRDICRSLISCGYRACLADFVMICRYAGLDSTGPELLLLSALFFCEGYSDDFLHCAWEEDEVCGGGDLIAI